MASGELDEPRHQTRDTVLGSTPVQEIVPGWLALVSGGEAALPGVCWAGQGTHLLVPKSRCASMLFSHRFPGDVDVVAAFELVAYRGEKAGNERPNEG